MNKVFLLLLFILCFDVSKGQTWDDSDWTDSFKESNVIHDTVTYDKFRIIESESWNFLLSNLDTIYEENYYPLRIELLKDNSDSNIILKTPTIDFNIYHWYDGFKIKAGLGLNEVVLYIGEVIDCDTVWLDTMVYHVKDQRRFMTFSNFDSICIGQIRLGEQLFGGIGHGLCNYTVPCKITEFKVNLRGSINKTFTMNSCYYSKELTNYVKSLNPGDEIYFYDIFGTTCSSKVPVVFENKNVIVKDCSW